MVAGVRGLEARLRWRCPQGHLAWQEGGDPERWGSRELRGRGPGNLGRTDSSPRGR